MITEDEFNADAQRTVLPTLPLYCTVLGLVVVFLKFCMLSISVSEPASRMDQIWAILARGTIPKPGRHAVSWTMRLQSIVQAASG